MTVTIAPAPASGVIRAPPSKSVTHRAFLLAARGDGVRVQSPLWSDDTHATLRGLQAMGARFAIEPSQVTFEPATLRPSSQAIDCGGSATTFRFLAALAASFPIASTLTGDNSLRARTSRALHAALVELGATVECREARAPWRIRGPLRSGTILVDGSEGSHTTSALLLTLPFLAGDSAVAIAGPAQSRPYVDVTLAALRHAGIHVAEDAGLFHVPGGQRVTSRSITVEGDWSSAAFPLCAGAITGGAVRVTGLDPHSAQGDRRIVEILQSFGVAARMTSDGAAVSGPVTTTPGAVDLGANPDLFPIVCVLAACPPGTTRIHGAAHLRGKESDRIAAMARGLASLGIASRELPDGLEVTGGRMHGGTVDALGDHRIHMAFAVAALAAQAPVTIRDGPSVAKSYPRFHADLDRLRGLEVTA